MSDKSKDRSPSTETPRVNVEPPPIDPNILSDPAAVSEGEETGDQFDGQIAVNTATDPLTESAFETIGTVGQPPEGVGSPDDFGVSFDQFTERARQGSNVESLLGSAESEADDPPDGKYGKGMISDSAGPGKGGGAGTTMGTGYGIPTSSSGEVVHSPVTATIGQYQGYKAYEEEMTRKAEEVHEARQRQEGAGSSGGSDDSEGTGDPGEAGGDSSDENEIVKTEVAADGTTYTYEDGTVVVVTEGGVATIHPDGSMDIRYNDGRTEHHDPPPKDAGGGAETSPIDETPAPSIPLMGLEESLAKMREAQQGGATDGGNIDPTRGGELPYQEGGGAMPDLQDKLLGGDQVDPDLGGGGGHPIDGTIGPGGNTDGNTTPAWDAPADPSGTGPYERGTRQDVPMESDDADDAEEETDSDPYPVADMPEYPEELELVPSDASDEQDFGLKDVDPLDD